MGGGASAYVQHERCVMGSDERGVSTVLSPRGGGQGRLQGRCAHPAAVRARVVQPREEAHERHRVPEPVLEALLEDVARDNLRRSGRLRSSGEGVQPRMG